MSWQTRSF